jgi:hypothetical protein
MTKTLSSTAVYAYTTLISMIVCLPFAIGMEGPQLQAGAAAAIAKVRSMQQHVLFEPTCVSCLYTYCTSHTWNQHAVEAWVAEQQAAGP